MLCRASLNYHSLWEVVCIYSFEKEGEKWQVGLHRNLFNCIRVFFLRQAVCIAVTIMLHYLFLVVFMWMLMEGVFLYIQLHPNKNIKMRMPICAGVAWGKCLPCGVCALSDNHHCIFVLFILSLLLFILFCCVATLCRIADTSMSPIGLKAPYQSLGGSYVPVLFPFE